MSECESTAGRWSTPGKPSVCPDCGAVMPMDKGRLKSWMCQRGVDTVRSEHAKLSSTPWTAWRTK